MRILMTGTSGRVGSVIAERLASEHELIGVDLQPGPWTTVTTDFTDSEFLSSGYLQGLDAIVHTAALHVPHLNSSTEAEFRRINVNGTSLLLDAALPAGVHRFVYSSTTSLYGHSLEPTSGAAVWVTEELPSVPRDIYDETKLEAEALVRSAAASRNGSASFTTDLGNGTASFTTDLGNRRTELDEGNSLTCVILRFGRCFPEEIDKLAVYRCYRGVDARDVAEAHFLAVTANLAHPFCETFNIAARTPFKRADCQGLFQDAPSVLRQRVPSLESWLAVRGHALPLSIDRVYVTERAKRLLGYQPKWNIDEFLNDNIL